MCQAGTVRLPWRRSLLGPKNGVARGTAVFGPAGFDEPDQLRNLLAQFAALRTWAGNHDIVLDGAPESLPALDRQLDAWSPEPDIGPRLGNEVGHYLGTVIVKHVPGSAWHVWPNGHPVVRLRSGNDLDVIAQVHRRLTSHEGTLVSIYAAAR